VETAAALDPKEADSMLKTPGQARKLLMVAHVLPFYPEFEELVRQHDRPQKDFGVTTNLLHYSCVYIMSNKISRVRKIALPICGQDC
jgi:hypothetical protein